MITRTLRGLGALALIALALIGWPAALLGLTDAVAVWLPDLSDPAALLSRPDTGGLFLVIVLALGWIAWVVWTVALIVEVAAQVRGVPTPHLGGLFPQNATAALVTAIAVAFTIAPATPAIAGTPGAGRDPGGDEREPDRWPTDPPRPGTRRPHRHSPTARPTPRTRPPTSRVTTPWSAATPCGTSPTSSWTTRPATPRSCRPVTASPSPTAGS